MTNSIETYTDSEILEALLKHDFQGLSRQFVDDVITAIKPGGFYQAQNLDTVSLPAVTAIGFGAFFETVLSTLELTWSGITSIGAQAFYKAWHALPQSLVLNQATVIGNAAFAGTSGASNTRLVSVSLPQWTGNAPTETGFSTGSLGTFEYCTALTTVSAPNATILRSYSFRGCTALEEVSFPKVKTIQSAAFTGCSKLKKLDIGGEVTAMNDAFLPTSGVFEALILRGVTTVPTLGTNTFNNTKIKSGTAYVYVPQSLEQLFKVANNWSTYSAQIRAIEDYPDVCGS